MMCVECGTEVPGLIDGSCPACYQAKHPLMQLPDVIDLELCSHCRARHAGAHWFDVPEEAPEAWIRHEAVREALRAHAQLAVLDVDVREKQQDAKHFAMDVILEGNLEGVEVTSAGKTLVRMRRGVCDRCSRRQGGFWSAIIQLRASERDVREDEMERGHRLVAAEITKALQAGNRLAFLQKEGPMHGGWDYYLGDIDTARAASRSIAQLLGGRVTESAKLVGRQGGDDVYRVTFLVRIDLFAPGDVAQAPDGTMILVHRTGHGRIHGLRLADHRPTRIAEAGSKRIGGTEVVEQALVVSSSPDTVQVMDPRSYATLDVPRPEGYRDPGEHVAVVRYEHGFYLVPGPMSKSS